MYLDNQELARWLKAPQAFHDEICTAFFNIARGMALTQPFTNYADRDDATSAAVLQMIENRHKFDAFRSSSPMAYFSEMAKRQMLKTFRANRRYASLVVRVGLNIMAV